MFLFDNTCTRIKRLLSERVDSPLSSRLENKVQKHVHGCEDCRKEADFYAELKSEAPNLETVNPPDYLWERISLSIEEHPWGDEDVPRQGFVFRLRTLLFGSINYAGAALTFALIGLLCFMPSGSPGNDSSSGSTSIRAEELETGSTYVSLYMMSHGDRFPYEVQDYYLNKLGTIDRQIKTVKSVLQRFPNNLQVKEQLARAYAHKLQMFNQMGITIPNDRFTGSGGSAHFDYDLVRGGRYE